MCIVNRSKPFWHAHCKLPQFFKWAGYCALAVHVNKHEEKLTHIKSDNHLNTPTSPSTLHTWRVSLSFLWDLVSFWPHLHAVWFNNFILSSHRNYYQHTMIRYGAGTSVASFGRELCGFSSASQDKPTSPGGGGPGSNPGPTRYKADMLGITPWGLTF